MVKRNLKLFIMFAFAFLSPSHCWVTKDIFFRGRNLVGDASVRLSQVYLTLNSRRTGFFREASGFFLWSILFLLYRGALRDLSCSVDRKGEKWNKLFWNVGNILFEFLFNLCYFETYILELYVFRHFC